MKRQCLVRGRKVFFYGKTATRIRKAAKAVNMTPQEWFTTMLTKYTKMLRKRNWPYLRTNMSGAKEYACPHGVGHGGIHGCDGCCGNGK